MMLGECTLEDCLHQEVQENLDVLPSDSNLAGAEIELLDLDKKEFILKEHLDAVRDNYDFIMIDCPPSLSLLTLNALTAGRYRIGADTMRVLCAGGTQPGTQNDWIGEKNHESGTGAGRRCIYYV